MQGPEMWSLLEKYQERYSLSSEVPELASLRRSLYRRRARRAALNRRIRDLKAQVEEAEAQLKAVNTELLGAQKAGAALLEDVLERVRIEKGEGWSPVPVLGFRAWRLMNGLLYGAKVVWQKPEMSADCLHRVSGEDLPHSVGKCGPPSCGIYAVKDLQRLKRELGPWGSSYVLGVVAMTGKVIEHEHGYRAARGTVVAITGKLEGNRFATDDPIEIAELFARTPGAAARSSDASVADTEHFLAKWKEKNEVWIWEKS